MNYKEAVGAWVSVLDSDKTSTLKFAVARAILDEVQESMPADREINISRERLSYRLVSYYWYQVRLFRLRQAAADIHEPNVVRKLRELGDAADYKFRPDHRDLETIVASVADVGFREVIPRFHRNTTQTIFQVKRGGAVIISGEHVEFVRTCSSILMRAVMLGWGSRLEKYNLTPNVLAKVSFDGKRRNSVSRHARALRHLGDTCFYCHCVKPSRVHVDHVIPWSFIFNDAAWNLVLACEACNSSKRDRLPGQDFLIALCRRNVEIAAQASGEFADAVRHSMAQLPHRGADGMQRSLEMLREQAILQGFTGDWLPSEKAIHGNGLKCHLYSLGTKA